MWRAVQFLRDRQSIHPSLLAVLLAVVAGNLGRGRVGLGGCFAHPCGADFVQLSATLRTTVSTDNVHVQYGMSGPKTPVATITSVKAVDYFDASSARSTESVDTPAQELESVDLRK